MKRLAVIVLGAALLSACSSGRKTAVRLQVLAAQSLASSFPELNAAFEKSHDNITVEATFGGSSLLATQIQEGAPGDVFVSADEPTMAKVATAKLVTGKASTVARNRLEIIVARDNPKHIAAVSDLTRSGLRIALCDVAVPCGAYATEAFTKAGVAAPASSREANVAGVVTKVTTGEADAGIVYTSDVQAAAAKAAGVTIPDTQNLIAVYPAAVLKSSAHATEAATFIAFLRSDAAQKILTKRGFVRV